MDIRMSINNRRTLDILNKVSKKERKFFIEEAILYYEKALRTEQDLHSLFLEVEKEIK